MKTFGGSWTEQKLTCVKKYVIAYEKVMKNKKFFTLMYIDAFAGPGYSAIKKDDQDIRNFQKNSPQIILKNTRLFNKYIFIEKDKKTFNTLKKLKDDFSKKQIDFKNEDANICLKKICKKTNWQRHRAIVFLDPFAMEVEWDTITSIANTQAIDLWILFPAMAVNRLLYKNKKIPPTFCKKLDTVFGSTDWKQDFYQESQQLNLFGKDTELEKTASFESIKSYYLKKLRSVFSGVADNPFPLKNSKHSILFYLCFAVSNPKGKTIALNIAQHILGRP